MDELVTTSSIDFSKRKKIYENLGDGCCYLQNYDKAISYYLQMLECALQNGETGKTLVPIYVSLYQTYKDNKQYEEALIYLWKEFELNKDVPLEAFSTLCTIADICELQMQSFWTIQDVYQKAKEQALLHLNATQEDKLLKVVMIRLKKLQIKHKMGALAEELTKEAMERGNYLSIFFYKIHTKSIFVCQKLIPLRRNYLWTFVLLREICFTDLKFLT